MDSFQSNDSCIISWSENPKFVWDESVYEKVLTQSVVLGNLMRVDSMVLLFNSSPKDVKGTLLFWDWGGFGPFVGEWLMVSFCLGRVFVTDVVLNLFHFSHNKLNSLPDEMVSLQSLRELIISFNRYQLLPPIRLLYPAPLRHSQFNPFCAFSSPPHLPLQFFVLLIPHPVKFWLAPGLKFLCFSQ